MVNEYLRRMRRRRDYLDQNTKASDHYAQSERAALAWAIQYIEDTLGPATDHQSKYFETKKEENNDKNKIHLVGNDSDNPVRELTAEH
jgi:hypothetical protein